MLTTERLYSILNSYDYRGDICEMPLDFCQCEKMGSYRIISDSFVFYNHNGINQCSSADRFLSEYDISVKKRAAGECVQSNGSDGTIYQGISARCAKAGAHIVGN